MTTAEGFIVPFSGCRVRSGPLTWSQRWTWDLLADLAPGAARLKMTLSLAVPDGRSVGDIKAALSMLIGRHEMLRTRFAVGDDGEPVQRVCGAGEFEVQVRYAAGTSVPDEADRFARELAGEPFDVAHELPVRFGVVMAAGAPSAVVLALAQLGFDGWSRMALARELRAALACAAEPSVKQPPTDLLQPVDHAAFERSAKGAASSAAALDYWREQLNHAEAAAAPRWPLPADSPRFWRAAFRSRAIGWATAMLSERLQVLPAAVLLSGFAAVLGHHLGQPLCVPQVVFHNRLRPASRLCLGHLAQQVPITLELADGGFADLVRRTSSRMLGAARFGGFDTLALQALMRDAGPGGGANERFPVVFNFDRQVAGLVGLAGEQTAAPDRSAVPGMGSSLTWLDTADDGDHGCYLNVYDSEEAYLMVWIDTSYLSKADLASVAFGTERLLMTATVGVAANGPGQGAES